MSAAHRVRLGDMMVNLEELMQATENQTERLKSRIRESLGRFSKDKAKRKKREAERQAKMEAILKKKEAYEVTIKEIVHEIVVDSDKVTNTLNITDILPKEEMAVILKGKLKKVGFKEKDDKTLTKTREGGELQVINVETLEVSTELSMEQKLNLEKEETAKAKGSVTTQKQKNKFKEDLKEKIKEELKTQAKEQIEKIKGSMMRKIADQLTKSENERKQELRDVILEVYKEAIKRKAKSLGTIVEAKENSGDDIYEMRIKITE